MFLRRKELEQLIYKLRADLNRQINDNRKLIYEDRKNSVKCEECKHRLDKEDMQGVEVRKNADTTYHLGTWSGGSYIGYDYYCPMHKRPYDKIEKIAGKMCYEKFVSEHWVRVDIKGQEIKKK